MGVTINKKSTTTEPPNKNGQQPKPPGGLKCILLGSLYLACYDKNAFFTSELPKRYKLWSCQKMCDALHYLLDNIFIRFGSKLYRQIVGIPMGSNCAPLVADLFLFCHERDFMLSLSDNNQTDIIEAFNSTS